MDLIIFKGFISAIASSMLTPILKAVMLRSAYNCLWGCHSGEVPPDRRPEVQAWARRDRSPQPPREA